MRACKVARYTAAIGGAFLAVVVGTTEAIASTTSVDIVAGFRDWMITLVIIAVISLCTAVVVERQERIIDLLTAHNAQDGAQHDYTNIERRLRGNGGNITTLYPEE